MTLPQPDAKAYTGDIIVKTQTYAKSKAVKASGLDKVRKAVSSLQEEADKRLTLERLDLTPEFLASVNELLKGSISAVDFQIFINKEICATLRKEALKLKTFLQNN